MAGLAVHQGWVDEPNLEPKINKICRLLSGILPSAA